jgi:hypothetical protein
MRFRKFLGLTAALLAGLFYLFPATPTTAAACKTLLNDRGLASTSITVNEPGEYTVWLRMLAPSAPKDSVLLQVDNQCAVVVGDNQHSNGFRWVSSHIDNTAKPVRFNLAVGAHTVKLTGHNLGVGVDKILLTPDGTCIPVALGDNCLEVPSQPNTEAEPNSETLKNKPTLVETKSINRLLVGACLTVILGTLGFLIWHYKRFVKKMIIEVEHVGEVFGSNLLAGTSLRLRLRHFLQQHRMVVYICGGIILIALLTGIVATAIGRSVLEVESATLYGGAKIVKSSQASGGKYVVFEANPAGKKIPSGALKGSGGKTGTSNQDGGAGGDGGSSTPGDPDDPPPGDGDPDDGTPPGECPAYPEFPDDDCTGWEHTGVTLKTCTEGDGDEGDGHLELSNVTYDGCDFADGAVIHGENVTIKRSRVQGVVSAHWSTDYDFRNLELIDVEIIAATSSQIAAKTMVNESGGSAINGANVSCLRCRIHYVPTGISLGNGSSIRDSYISDVTWGPGAHQAAIGAGGNSGHNSTIIHNRLDCSRWNTSASGFQQGCSSALSLYDEPTLNNVLVQNNLFNTAGGFCTYGGGPQGTNIRYVNNKFGKKYSSTCGIYGPVSAFYDGNSGNSWTGNSWHDGSGTVSP